MFTARLSGQNIRDAAPALRFPALRPLVRAGSTTSFTLLRGRDAILGARQALAELAIATGQAGETDSVALFLSTPDALRKTPHLLLLNDPRGQVNAAALLFEYSTRMGRTRVFATGDGSGRRDLIAPPELRARTAAMVARTLISTGAHIVHLAFCEVHEDSDAQRDPLTGATPLSLTCAGTAERTIAEVLRSAPQPAERGRGTCEWALSEREIPSYLPLFATFDATLARIGPKTRTNLRYYRRRAEQHLACTFVPVVSLSLAELEEFSRACTYTVPADISAFRHRAAQASSNYFIRGMRDGNGRWLSLVGTRRQNGFVDIDWQMNRNDLPQHSLATVMRSYLIEHEIGLGSTRLYMEGGTPQSIGRSFLRQRIGELTVKRDSAYVRLLQRFAPFVFPPKNYVGQTLIDPSLHWKRW
jgi:hypothetical protein